MRVTKQVAAENRRRILTAAARLFREQGIDGAGVDAITEAVVAEALRLVLDESRDLWARDASGEDKSDALERVIDRYLSPRHRDSPGAGCAVAALGSDVARQPGKIRDVFSKRLGESLEILAGLIPARTASRRYDAAIRLFSTLVGALILARAVRDEALSRRILQAAANGLKDGASG
jgi:TetR/AcrR family transcriptional repressor of nem operon